MDNHLVALIEGGVSIMVATRGDDLMPDVVQGLAARVLADGQVVVVISRPQGEGVLECLESGHPIAVTFSQPVAFRTVQLKAGAAAVGKAKKADVEATRRHQEAFAEQLRRLGYDDAFARAIVDPGEAELVTLRFTPTAAFEQTPGHAAGDPMTAEAPGA